MLFAELPGFWTPVMPAHELRREPVGIFLAGERVVLFRGRDGVTALMDRCPHRGVALSLGRVTEDGCLECPFHGWQFRGDGGCARVPLNPDARTDLLGATALPAREAGGLVWVFTGERADAEPPVPEALTRPGVRRAFVAETWDTHWTRAMENMLDSPHLPYVHRRTIGRAMRRDMTPGSTVSQRVVPTEGGFELYFSMDGRPESRLDWLRPNGMALHILDDGRRLVRIHAYCIPEREDRTRMLVVAAQDFGIWTPLAALGDWFNARILTEDRAVVESSQPKRVPPPGDEASVASDKPTLRFRSWYYRAVASRDPGASDAGTSIQRARRNSPSVLACGSTFVEAAAPSPRKPRT